MEKNIKSTLSVKEKLDLFFNVLLFFLTVILMNFGYFTLINQELKLEALFSLISSALLTFLVYYLLQKSLIKDKEHDKKDDILNKLDEINENIKNLIQNNNTIEDKTGEAE